VLATGSAELQAHQTLKAALAGDLVPNESGFPLVGVTGFELPPQALSDTPPDYQFQRCD